MFLVVACLMKSIIAQSSYSGICPLYSTANTNSDTQNYYTCSTPTGSSGTGLCQGMKYSIGSSSCASCSGDQMLSLYTTSGSIVNSNDDYNYPSCSCSQMQGYMSLPGCNSYVIREGCYGATSCSGAVSVNYSYTSCDLTGLTVQCPTNGMYCSWGGICTFCAPGYYCTNGYSETACPTGYTSPTGSSLASQCYLATSSPTPIPTKAPTSSPAVCPTGKCCDATTSCSNPPNFICSGNLTVSAINNNCVQTCDNCGSCPSCTASPTSATSTRVHDGLGMEGTAGVVVGGVGALFIIIVGILFYLGKLTTDSIFCRKQKATNIVELTVQNPIDANETSSA